ncbi:MAG: NTP transferase domain-containing protein [bacterium]
MKRDFIGLVLAAGKGVRMKSDLPKVLHAVGGRPMVMYPVELLQRLGAKRIIVVIGRGAQEVAKVLGGGVETVVQNEQRGTGHAVMCAAPLLEGEDVTLLSLYGDVPLLRHKTLEQLMNSHHTGAYAATLLTALLDDPAPYGRIIRDNNGNLLKIVEARDATPDELKIKEINAGIYYFQIPPMLDALKEIGIDNAQGEYYLTDVIGVLRRKGCAIGTVTTDEPREILGVNTRDELDEVNRLFEEWKNK